MIYSDNRTKLHYDSSWDNIIESYYDMMNTDYYLVGNYITEDDVAVKNTSIFERIKTAFANLINSIRGIFKRFFEKLRKRASEQKPPKEEEAPKEPENNSPQEKPKEPEPPKEPEKTDEDYFKMGIKSATIDTNNPDEDYLSNFNSTMKDLYDESKSSIKNIRVNPYIYNTEDKFEGFKHDLDEQKEDAVSKAKSLVSDDFDLTSIFFKLGDRISEEIKDIVNGSSQDDDIKRFEKESDSLIDEIEKIGNDEMNDAKDYERNIDSNDTDAKWKAKSATYTAQVKFDIAQEFAKQLTGCITKTVNFYYNNFIPACRKAYKIAVDEGKKLSEA